MKGLLARFSNLFNKATTNASPEAFRKSINLSKERTQLKRIRKGKDMEKREDNNNKSKWEDGTVQ